MPRLVDVRFTPDSLALLANASGEPSLGRELTRELASADRVDLLCAFVKWSGLRFVLDDLAALVRRARERREAAPLRVLTTTYVGASARHRPRHVRSRGIHRGTLAQSSSYSAPNLPRSVGSSYPTTNRWNASHTSAP